MMRSSPFHPTVERQELASITYLPNLEWKWQGSRKPCRHFAFQWPLGGYSRHDCCLARIETLLLTTGVMFHLIPCTLSSHLVDLVFLVSPGGLNCSWYLSCWIFWASSGSGVVLCSDVVSPSAIAISHHQTDGCLIWLPVSSHEPVVVCQSGASRVSREGASPAHD